jgi:hypothetical protein
VTKEAWTTWLRAVRSWALNGGPTTSGRYFD